LLATALSRSAITTANYEVSRYCVSVYLKAFWFLSFHL
jgi:hypothetical protein